MKTRSPSADKICAIAIDHFAQHGYDGSSLSDIAQAAGMRKASLYAHFAGKDELFLDAFEDALEDERAFIAACFVAEDASRGAGLPGARYCERMADRYGKSAHLRLLLRTAYLPPAGLRAHISPAYEALLAGLQLQYRAVLSARFPALTPERIELYAQAYTGIVDSLHVELIYADGAAMQVRHAALWRVLSDSLRMAAA